MLRKIDRLRRRQYISDTFRCHYDELLIGERFLRYATSGRNQRKRNFSLLVKEPTTIPWLESFQQNDVFVDVGANVGMYSIYAAIMTGARVYSFEPEALNYAELNKNIFLNDLYDRITAYCLALSDDEKISQLYLSTFSVGFSHHDFGENLWKKDKKLGSRVFSREKRPRQGSISITLDKLVKRGDIPVPNHIKIDVDGIEAKVVRGCLETLARPELKSVLIETDFKIPESVALVDLMTERGWRYSKDQIRIARYEPPTNEHVESIMRNRKGGRNFIYFRDPAYFDLFADFATAYVDARSQRFSSEKLQHGLRSLRVRFAR